MKITLDDIKQNLSQYGWKVLSEEYKNLYTEMEFECDKGHKVIVPYKNIRTTPLCPTCTANQYSIETSIKPIPKTKKFRILAIDQATHISGWSLWDEQTLIKYGHYKSPYTQLIDKLSDVHQWLLSLIANYKPDMIIFEDIQMQDFSGSKNKYERSDSIGVTTYKALAELLGVLTVTAKENNIDFKVCAPATWRAKVGIKGAKRPDQKRSAQFMVRNIFDINVTEDEADAICLGTYATKEYHPIEMIKWE